MAHFDLSNYTTVAERITKFYEDHPEGRILTELLKVSESGKQFIVQATIYPDAEGGPVATGLAEEHFADRGPNETSPLENAETSAIGRALVNWKYSSGPDDRPSREEMSKVNRNAKPSGPSADKQRVSSDPRWEIIKDGAASDPSNDFLTDIVKKGEQYGALSEKQIAAAHNAAKKVLTGAASGPVAKAFPGATEMPGEEPF